MEYLDDHDVEYDQIEVRRDPAAMQKLTEVSGQTKTPTLVWDGDVLADFGVEELEPFLAEHDAGD